MIIISELRRCIDMYSNTVKQNVQSFVELFFSEKFNNDINSVLGSSYDINGETMDRRKGDNELARVVRTSIGVDGYIYDKIKAKVSMFMFKEITKYFKAITIDNIKQKILSPPFSEWGSLLLHEEVMMMIKVFDEVDDNDDDSSNRYIFDELIWMLKILSIDQPADLTRYKIPKAYMDDNLTRKIMSSRVDLSKDAIARIKINIV